MSADSSRSRWATQAVDDAIRVGCLRGFVACPAAMACVVLVSGTTLPVALLLAIHAAYGLGALAVLWRSWDVRVSLISFYLLLLVDLVVSTGPAQPLAVVAAWLALVTTGTPALLLRGFQAALLPFGASAAMAATVSLLRPEWGYELPIALIVGTLATWPASLMFRRTVDALVVRTDAQEATVEEQYGQLLATRTAARELAEDARVLHDSVINTLAAIASGGSWAGDIELIRRRCRRDVGTIENLLAGRRDQPLGIVSVPDAGISIRRTGLQDDEFERHAALLSADVVRALSGAVEELIHNAVKHAGTDEVVVDLRRRDDEVVVTFSDKGVGFDGTLITGRGLAESVVKRVESVGGRVQIESRPGAGTTITMACSVHQRQGTDGYAENDVAENDDAETEVERIRRTACWSWAVGIFAAGMLIEVGNRPGRYTLAWAAVALVAALSLMAWWVSRRRHDLPGWTTILVVAGLPAGYLLGFAGVGSGHDEPYLWFPIGLTPLLIILLVLGRTRLPLAAGVTVMMSAAAIVAAALWHDDRQAAVIALTVVLIQLCQMVAWLVFYQTVGRVGRRLVWDQRQATASRREVAARQAVTTARERWTAAGVRSSIDLLRTIADGQVDPSGPVLRARCDEEERYLRQLILISPELVHLSGWFARALAEARSRSVRLTLRSGDADVSEHVASQLGRLVMSVIAATPAGSDLTVSLFAGHGRPRLHFVARGGLSEVDRLRASLPAGWTLEHRSLGGQALVVVLPSS